MRLFLDDLICLSGACKECVGVFPLSCHVGVFASIQYHFLYVEHGLASGQV